MMLDESGVEDVMGGDDRVGFLPRWYWDEMELTTESAYRGEGPQIQAGDSGVPAGWRI